MNSLESALIERMIDISSNACGVFDKEGCCIYANELLLNLAGITDPAMKENCQADFLDFSSANYNKSLLWNEMVESAQEKPFTLSVRLGVSPSRVFRCRLGVFAANSHELYMLVLNDITPQAELSARLAERDSLLDRVISEFPLMISAADNEGLIRIWNKRCEEITGFSRSEMIDNPNALALLFPSNRYRYEILSKWNSREDNSVRHWNMEIACKDGSIKHISWTVRYRENPIIPGLYTWGIGQDITDSKEVFEQLSLSEERFALISRATHDAVYDWDIPGNHLWWSDGMTKLFGHNTTQIADTIEWWTENLHPSYREDVFEGMQQAMDRGDSVWTDEYLFRKHDGTYAYVSDKGYFERDADGKVIRMIGGMIDLTRQNNAELRLQEKDEELRKILHFNAKRLRGPLARIMQITKLLAVLDHHKPEVKEMIDQLLISSMELDTSYKRLSLVADDDDED